MNFSPLALQRSSCDLVLAFCLVIRWTWDSVIAFKPPFYYQSNIKINKNLINLLDYQIYAFILSFSPNSLAIYKENLFEETKLIKLNDKKERKAITECIQISSMFQQKILNICMRKFTNKYWQINIKNNNKFPRIY